MCHFFSLYLLLFCFFFSNLLQEAWLTVLRYSAAVPRSYRNGLRTFSLLPKEAALQAQYQRLTHTLLRMYSVNPKQQQKWNLQPAMTRCENKTFCVSINLTNCCADCGGEATQHGRDPYSPLTPGQPQRHQPRAPGATKDQQALVPELPAPRASPQTLCCAGV